MVMEVFDRLLDRLPLVGKARETKRKQRAIRLMFTGFAMGAADIVPGVSGGTIALILGVYEELVYSIKVASGDFVKALLKADFKKAVEVLPIGFLLPLGFGILGAVVSLANVIRWLLANKPVYLWAFFFGLVVASVWVVRKRVKKWDATKLVVMMLAAVGAFAVVGTVPVETPESLLAFFS